MVVKTMKKNIYYIFIIIIFLNMVLSQSCFSSGGEEIINNDIILKQFQKLDLEDLKREVEKINDRAGDYLPELNIKKILISLSNHKFNYKWKDLIISFIKYLGNEVTANFRLMGKIIILAIFTAVLNLFHESFSNETISNTAKLLIFLLLAVLLLQSFKLTIDIGIKTIDYMVSFMQALLPVLLSLLVGVGAVSSAAIFHPFTYIIITILSTLIKNLIFPMIFISAVLNIVNNISNNFNISSLAKLFKEFSMGLLTLFLLIFVGGLLLQGGAAALADSLTLRTAKYLTGTFIPVIGGILSDAVDLIVSCSLIIKNALNIFGVLAILFIIIYPIIKILAIYIVYRFVGAILQPVCDEGLINMFEDLANSLLMVFLVVLTVSFMFFIILTIITGAANLTVMMR